LILLNKMDKKSITCHKTYQWSLLPNAPSLWYEAVR